MASLEEYLRGAPVSGRQGSEYEKLVKSLQTYGSTANTAQALGVSPESTNPALGVLDFLLSPDKGILTKPARGIRRGIFTLLGEPTADTSGFGNFRGLKVQKDDSILEKAGKLAGAFTLDVATDPLSYLGAPTSVGRAGVAKIASNLGEQSLDALAAASKIDRGKLVDVLAERSRVGQAAKLQAETGLEDDTVSTLASNLFAKNKETYAKRELGNIMAESLYTRGRRGLVADLASVAKLAGADDELAVRSARKVFSELPDELRGGLRFLNPVTGKSYARLAPSGSTGILESIGLGSVADVGNRARFFTARNVGAGATKYLSGQAGPILQGAKRGAKGQTQLPEPSLGRPTILDWSTFGKEVTKRDQVLWNLQQEFMSPLYIALKAGETIGKDLGEDSKQVYNDLLFQGLTSRTVRPPAGVSDRVVLEAQQQAGDIRATLNKLLAEMNDAGFEIGDLSPDFFPMMFTPEAARAFKQTARSGRVSTGYTGAGGRKFGFRTIDDPDEGDEFGFLIEGFDDVYAANPKTASKIIADRLEAQGYKGFTEESFITDPIAAMTSYVNVMTQKLSTKRFADSLAESGLLIKDVPVSVQRLHERAISTLGSTLRTLRPQAKENIDKAVEQAKEQLQKQAGGATKVAARLREETTKAKEQYRIARQNELDAEDVVREAQADLDRIRGELQNATPDVVAKRAAELEAAVVRQTEAANASRAATVASRASRDNYNNLVVGAEMNQIDSIRIVADSYVAARTAVKQAQASGAAPEVIEQAVAAEARAKELLDRVLTDNKNLTGAAKEYADNLRVVSEKLTRAELDAATILSAEDKIRQFIEVVSNPNNDPAVVDAMFTDMTDTYILIRSKITKEQLDALSPQQRSVYDATEPKKLGESAAKRLKEQGAEGITGESVIGFTLEDLVRSSKDRSEFGQSLSLDLGNPNAALHPLGGAFEDMYAPLEIKQSLDQLYDMTRRPTEWQRKIEDYLDPALLLWRLQVTQLRGPGYTMLNLSGGTFNNMIGGVTLANSFGSARTIKNFIQAERQIRKEFPEVPDIASYEKVQQRLEELLGKEEFEKFAAFMVRGGADTTSTIEQIRQATMLGTQVSERALTRRGSRALVPNEPPTTKAGVAGRRVVDFMLTNRVSGFFNDVNQTTEMYLRYAAFRQGFDNFKNYDAAMDLSMALHFNYADLSQAEKWVRRVVPFYTWMRNNLPLQVRTMFLQPSKITKFLYAREELENAFGEDENWLKMMLPEYAQISGGFAVNVGGNRLFFVDRLPYQDLNTMFQVSANPFRTRNIAGAIGPAGGLYGAIAGVDTGTGRAFDPAGTPAPLWARPLAPFLPKDAEGEPLIPEALNAIVSEAVPLLGTVERAAGTVLPEGIAPTTQTDRRLSSFLNLIGAGGAAGQSVGTLTPRVARGELRRRQIALSNQLISAAEQMNVDLDWVREQLRAGATPEQVFAAIQTGYGQRAAGSAEPSSLDVEKQQAIERLIAGM